MAVKPRQRRLGALSDPGLVRPNNEDAYRVIDERSLYAVADGMGGHRAGEVASTMAVDTVATEPFDPARPGESLEAMVRKAHERIRSAGAADPRKRGMGTTLTVAHVGPERITIAHVGDSRAYLIGEGQPRQLTKDHSLAGALVNSGQLEPAAARLHPQRHMLTQAVGAQEALDVELVQVPWTGWNYFLLCTDGLTETVSESELDAIVHRAASVEEGAAALVGAARRRGAPDNVTVVLIDLAAHGGMPVTDGLR